VTEPAWDDSAVARAWPAAAPLRGAKAADVCVVGLGASGLAAVEAALDRGLRVVGVDAGRVASGAAGRNGGFLLGGGARFPHEAAAEWGVDAMAALHRATLAELDHLVARFPDVVRRTGSLRIADDDAEADDCVQHVTALRAVGIRAESWDGPPGPGVLLPDDGAVDPVARCLATAAAVLERGGDRVALHEASPVVAVGSGGVTTTGGSVSAGAVVVCVDGGLERLVPDLVGRVRTARLQMLAAAPLGRVVLERPVYLRWGFDYAQQDPAGRLLVGGGRDLGGEAEWTHDQATTPVVQAHLDALARRLAGGAVTVTHRWSGAVGYTPDHRPVVDLVDGIAVAGGYCGVGNLVGPLAARAALALALDGDASAARLVRG
jgi:gamma-glutamylputrescine oxidase